MILRVFRVRDESLSPDIRDGDYVAASAVPILFRRVRPGDVVVFRQPAYGRLVKRVEQVEPDGSLFVVGDDPTSVDSRVFGVVKAGSVLGLVVWRIGGQPRNTRKSQKREKGEER